MLYHNIFGSQILDDTLDGDIITSIVFFNNDLFDKLIDFFLDDLPFYHNCGYIFESSEGSFRSRSNWHGHLWFNSNSAIVENSIIANNNNEGRIYAIYHACLFAGSIVQFHSPDINIDCHC